MKNLKCDWVKIDSRNYRVKVKFNAQILVAHNTNKDAQITVIAQFHWYDVHTFKG